MRPPGPAWTADRPGRPVLRLDPMSNKFPVRNTAPDWSVTHVHLFSLVGRVNCRQSTDNNHPNNADCCEHKKLKIKKHKIRLVLDLSFYNLVGLFQGFSFLFF